MEPCIKDWLTVLSQMKNTNTYKLSFGLGIFECVLQKRYQKDALGNHFLSLRDIAECMIRYYWNQSFFFKLKQQPGEKVPIVYQCVNELIDHYCQISHSNLPVWSDKGLSLLNEVDPLFYEKMVNRAAKTLPNYVVTCLKNVSGGSKDLYRYESRFLVFSSYQITLLEDYNEVLSRLFSYKWSQLLEKWNESPRILGKILGAEDRHMPRSSLSEFKKPLSLEF